VATIETERLTKRYGSHRGIDDVTLTVEQGEVFGLLGPNGAGKTTLIRTLLDLLHPTSGSARLFGLDSRRDSLAIRRRLGNLPGDFAYGPPSLTGRDVLALFAQLRGMDGLGQAEQLATRFRAALDRPIGQLSRGNRQKVGLLQALFHQPELLILDEPTSGLDPLMQEQFLAVVGEQREAGRTVLMSSHDLDEIERVCDRVGIIKDGRLIAVERVAELVGKSYRHVSLTFAEPVDSAEFAALPGVSDVTARDGTIAFKASGDLDPVVKAAARHPVRDMQLAHPTLEEVFLTYYADSEDDL
jgi:beta-exotoxin I transport system ATP-binding protein